MDNDMINEPTATERMRSVIETMTNRLVSDERVGRREMYSALLTLGTLLDEVDASMRTVMGLWLSKIKVDNDGDDGNDDDAEYVCFPVFTAVGTDDLVVADAGRFDVVGRSLGDDMWEVSTIEFGSGVTSEHGVMTGGQMQQFAADLYDADDLV